MTATSAPRRIYLDHVAGSPLHPEAQAAMDALGQRHGSPASPHAEGQARKAALEAARDRLAGALGCRPREIVFTSGREEACRIGLAGLARARPKGPVVVAGIEHPAVVAAAEQLAREGYEPRMVGPDPQGRIRAEAFLEACLPGTAAAALMLANHETGVIQPVQAVGEALAARGIPLFCDAALGPGRMPCRPEELPASVLAYASPLCGGPYGVGVLVVRRGTSMEGEPAITDGSSFAGNEPIAALAGAAVAMEDALGTWQTRNVLYREWESRFLNALGEGAPTPLGDDAERVAGVLALDLHDVDGEAAMMCLDLLGIAVSTGSPCALGGRDPSPALLAMGMTRAQASRTVRLSVGEPCCLDDAEVVSDALQRTLFRLRALRTGDPTATA